MEILFLIAFFLQYDDYETLKDVINISADFLLVNYLVTRESSNEMLFNKVTVRYFIIIICFFILIYILSPVNSISTHEIILSLTKIIQSIVLVSVTAYSYNQLKIDHIADVSKKQVVIFATLGIVMVAMTYLNHNQKIDLNKKKIHADYHSTIQHEEVKKPDAQKMCMSQSCKDIEARLTAQGVSILPNPSNKMIK